MNDLTTVQAALARLDDFHAKASERAKPRIDGLRAVVRADLNDRRVGITVEGEYTPGLNIASTV